MKKDSLNILLQDVEIPHIVQEKAQNAFKQIHLAAELQDKMPNEEKDKVNAAKKSAPISEMGSRGRYVKSAGGRAVKAWYVKAAAIACVIVLGGGGITAAAAALYNWHQRTTEYFHVPSTEVQEEALEKGIVTEHEISASDQGITISVVETVRDANRMYMLLNVETDSPILDKNSFLPMPEFISKEPNLFGNIGSILLSDELESGSTQCYYEIDAMKNREVSWPEELTVQFESFQYYTYENGEEMHTVDGNWKLTIPLDDTTMAETYRYELNRDVELSGVPVTINYIELSPISVKTSVNLDDYQQIHAEVYGNAENAYISETQVYAVVLEDGTIQEVGMAGMSGVWEKDTNENLTEMGFVTMIQPEKVTAVLLGEDRVRVELK